MVWVGTSFGVTVRKALSISRVRSPSNASLWRSLAEGGEFEVSWDGGGPGPGCCALEVCRNEREEGNGLERPRFEIDREDGVDLDSVVGMGTSNRGSCCRYIYHPKYVSPDNVNGGGVGLHEHEGENAPTPKPSSPANIQAQL